MSASEDHPTLRLARTGDAAALRELLVRALGTSPAEARAEVDALLRDGFTLLLPRGAGAGAAVHLTIDDRDCRLALLVIGPGEDPIATEARLLAVAEAMCEAYGCRAMSITRRDVRSAGRAAAGR